MSCFVSGYEDYNSIRFHVIPWAPGIKPGDWIIELSRINNPVFPCCALLSFYSFLTVKTALVSLSLPLCWFGSNPSSGTVSPSLLVPMLEVTHGNKVSKPWRRFGCFQEQAPWHWVTAPRAAGERESFSLGQLGSLCLEMREEEKPGDKAY